MENKQFECQKTEVKVILTAYDSSKKEMNIEQTIHLKHNADFNNENVINELALHKDFVLIPSCGKEYLYHKINDNLYKITSFEALREECFIHIY